MLAAMDGSTIVAIGHATEDVTLFGRTIELVEDADAASGDAPSTAAPVAATA